MCPGEEVLQRAELEEKETEYGPGDQVDDQDQEDHPTSSPLHSSNPRLDDATGTGHRRELWSPESGGSAGCHVSLCPEACFKAWDHVNCLPRSLVVQCAHVEPGSEVGASSDGTGSPLDAIQRRRAALRGGRVEEQAQRQARRRRDKEIG